MTSSRRSGKARRQEGPQAPPAHEPPDASPSAQEEGLQVGQLVGVFGLKGEVKLLPLTDYPEHLLKLRALRLRFPDGTVDERRVLSAREHNRVFLVRLEGCERVEDAELLRGAEVWIRPDQAAPLPEGEYYVHEIVGLRVVTEDGEELGHVDEVMRTPANDVYRVGRLLVPATRDAVVRLDPPNGVVVTRSRAYLQGEEA